MYKKSAFELHQAFIEGKLTASEIAAGFLQRIQSLDEVVKSFLNVFADRVMERAEKLDGKRAAGQPLGKLAGIPIAVKDKSQAFVAADVADFAVPGKHIVSQIFGMDQRAAVMGDIIRVEDRSQAGVLDDAQKSFVLDSADLFKKGTD